jgi:acetylornithine deacetylase/succinyl-diaminopimelate desuccinylase-like protein
MPNTLKDSILAHIAQDEVIGLSKDLVNIPSYTTDETEVAKFLHGFFQRHGLESELQEVDPGRFQTIGRLRGSGGGKSLMLNGHLDIDPIPSGWVRNPWTPTIEGDRFYGAGIYNMKGGVAAMVMAAVAAKRAGGIRGDVVVACVDGELQGGVGTVHLLKRGVRADMAVVPEPYSTKHIITKHTGVMELAVHVLGRSAHISRMEQGINAIGKAARVVPALEALKITGAPDPDLPGLPRMNIGTIIGGRGRELEVRGANIVPDVCTIILDIRFPQSVTPECPRRRRRDRQGHQVRDRVPDASRASAVPRGHAAGVGAVHRADRADRQGERDGDHWPGTDSWRAVTAELRRKRHRAPVGRWHPLLPLRSGRRLRRGPLGSLDVDRADRDVLPSLRSDDRGRVRLGGVRPARAVVLAA